jgi:hypothetical protein
MSIYGYLTSVDSICFIVLAFLFEGKVLSGPVAILDDASTLALQLEDKDSRLKATLEQNALLTNSRRRILILH